MAETFTCPKCGRTSYNPNDVKHSYCGACHEFFDQPPPPGEGAYESATDPSGDPEYERWCFESSAEHGSFVPMNIDRLAASNRCVACGEPPTNDNPVTVWAGQPADLENGPSYKDLPYALHDNECWADPENSGWDEFVNAVAGEEG